MSKPLLKKTYALLLTTFALSTSGLAWATIAQPELPVSALYKTEKVVQTLPMPTLPETTTASSYWYDEEAQTGDTLALVLKRLGATEKSIQNFVKNSPYNPETPLHSGQIITARVDSVGEITDIQFFENEDDGRHLIAIQRINDKWQMNSNNIDTETMPSLRSVVVNTSASGALSRAGVPVEVRIALKEMFADKFNLDELAEGDTISLLYESLYFRGQEVATGNILAAEVHTKGTAYKAYYFEPNDAAGGSYYDENGDALKKGFAGLPIEHFTRISSPYGIRIHPVFHTVRMHTGVDYAAPTGTPILATADGVVTFRGVKGGYGNAVMLQHPNGIETLYGHMSAFVSGVTEGKTVHAGEIIGLVGQSGVATGPHLHYEVRINGQHVNPATVALPTPKLSTQDLAALKKYQEKTNETMVAVRGLPVMVSQLD